MERPLRLAAKSVEVRARRGPERTVGSDRVGERPLQRPLLGRDLGRVERVVGVVGLGGLDEGREPGAAPVDGPAAEELEHAHRQLALAGPVQQLDVVEPSGHADEPKHDAILPPNVVRMASLPVTGVVVLYRPT